MKYRPSARVIWLVIPILPVVLMSVVFVFEEDAAASRIATRGTKPPEERLLAKPLEWCDDGVSAVMSWELNPQNHKYLNPFGSNFYTLSHSDDPLDQVKYKELLRLGHEWYERLLARYPALKVAYKDLPEEQNALLQWHRFAKKHDESNKAQIFYREVDDFFRNPKFHPWDPVAARKWLEGRRDFLNEARAIALMPDRSSKMPAGEREMDSSALFIPCARAFLIEARLHAEQGDAAAALASLRAIKGISRHLGGGEAPDQREAYAGDSIQGHAAVYTLSSIIPSLPAGQIDLAAWEEVVCRDLQQPADFARRIRGEWNTGMGGSFLANLADSSDPATPTDAEFLAEEYTRFADSQVRQTQSLLLADLPAHRDMSANCEGLSRRSKTIAAGLGMTEVRDRRDTWEHIQVSAGRIHAAFAILRGEPVPNDPIDGQPYRWDPATRELRFPDLPKYQRHNPLIVPKR